MADKKTQKTPKGHEIPVPKRKDFDAILEKATRRGIITPPIREPSTTRRPKK
jgi:hypothetical protein